MSTTLAKRVAQRYLVAMMCRAAVPAEIPAAIERDIATVTAALSGAAKNKFLGGIQIIRDSIAQGGWVTRGSVKASAAWDFALATGKRFHNTVFPSGKTYAEMQKMEQFGPEMAEQRDHPHYKIAYAVHTALGGGTYHEQRPPDDALPIVPGVSIPVIRAALEVKRWVLVEAIPALNAARPVPVKTEIKLSPKVTRVLQGMRLDIDLSSVQYPKLKEIEVEQPDGSINVQIVPDWPPGTKLHMTGYHGGWSCEACGKTIPSRTFVPLLMKCRREGLVGMLVGQDCARNIFGVRDVGIKR